MGFGVMAVKYQQTLSQPELVFYATHAATSKKSHLASTRGRAHLSASKRQRKCSIMKFRTAVLHFKYESDH